jgi:hypothetical protein
MKTTFKTINDDFPIWIVGGQMTVMYNGLSNAPLDRRYHLYVSKADFEERDSTPTPATVQEIHRLIKTIFIAKVIE